LSDIEFDIAQLTQAFNEGKIQLNELNSKLDNLLDKFGVNSAELSQAC
jgi:flagellar capping protein FliD